MKNCIKKYREKNGITQGLLAEEAGIAQSSMSDIERGAQIPSIEVALRIAHALEIPVETLFILEPDEMPDNE